MHNKKCSAFLFSLVFAVVLFTVSCYSAGNGKQQSSRDNPSVTDKPTDYSQLALHNNLVIIGAAPRYLNRDDSVKAALNDAARKLSFFYSVSGSSESLQRIGSTSLDVEFGSSYQLQFDSNLDNYLEMLEYDVKNDVFESNNAVFITTRVTSDILMPAFRGNSASGTRPGWIDSPPSHISGFITGVGLSGRLVSHCDTVVRSYEKAVIAIIESISVSIHNEHMLNQDNSVFGFEAQSSGGSRASGILENFYVIETWTDPSSLSVWTLAVAREKF
ncbi:MAG: hypothetical protein FWC06_03700 [Treponema sp.]|nr:hypothetical protein [Treponema sp.]